MQQRRIETRGDWIDALLLVVLIAILVVGLLLRTYHMDWDRGHFYLYHPDERALVYSAINNISFPIPPDWHKLLTPQSPLNPHFFNYGSLPMYLIRGTAHLLSFVVKNAWTTDNLWMSGRGLSALFDIITIFLAFLMGRKLYGRRVGLLAALFGTFTVLNIQLSHFLTVDTFLTTFITLGMYFAIDIVRKGSLKATLLTGAALGFAMGTKVSVAPLLASIVVAWAVWTVRGSSDLLTRSQERLTSADRLAKAILGTLIALLAAGLCFVISEPYAIIDWTNFIRSVDEQSRMVRGIADYPYTRQYLNTPIFLYQIWMSSVWGMGLPLGIAAYAGLAFVTLRTLMRRRSEEIVLLSWVLVYFFINGIFQVKFLRYMLPLFPFLMIMGAELLWQLWDWAGRIKEFRSPFHVPVAYAQGKKDEDYPNIDAETEAWEREQASQPAKPGKRLRRAANTGHRRPKQISLAAVRPTQEETPQRPDVGIHESSPHMEQPPAADENSHYTATPLAVEEGMPDAETPPAADASADQLSPTLTEGNIAAAPEIGVPVSAPDTEHIPPAGESAVPAVMPLPTVEPIPAAGLPAPQPRHIRDMLMSITKGQMVVGGIMFVIIAATMFYAFAFLNVYRQTHPWVTISEWIYRNVPPGSTIANEHWDDALPLALRVDGQERRYEQYKHVEMANYEDDNQTKLDMIVNNLQKADYVVLATNRLYDTIPRLGDRYPITKRYYELLFAGKLGFKLVAAAATYPSLFGVTIMNDTFVDPKLPRPAALSQTVPPGLVINLGKADESFTVYDHPMPLVFQKVENITPDDMRAMFAGTVEAAQQYQIRRQQAGGRAPARAPSKTFLMSDSVRRAQEAGGTYMALFNPANLANRLPVLFWWLAVELIALAALPIGFVVFGNLRDRGYGLTKALGILLVAFPPWLTASLRLIPFSNRSIMFGIGLVGLLSGMIVYRRRADMLAWLREQRWLILTTEAVFSGAFLAFVIIRMLNPDLWQPWNGGEKPMEFAFLGAIARSTYFPPYDPFFAGGYINYYYYGQYLGAMLIRLLGMTPSVAFNLIVPLLFALTFVNAFSVTYNLVAALRKKVADFDPSASLGSFLASHGSLLAWALAGALFVAVIGNLATLGEVFKGPYNKGTTGIKSSIPGLTTIARVADGLSKGLKPGQQVFEPFNYWNPSRVIPDTINEFPYWSYLFADLHPHMIGMPFTILVLGLALNVMKERRRKGRSDPPPGENSATSMDSTLMAEPPSTLHVGLAWIQEHLSGVTLGDILSTVVIGLALGSLGVINTWDLPTYFAVVFATVLLRAWLENGRFDVLEAVVRFGSIAVLSFVLYLPFYQNYQALASGIGLVRSRTPVGYYLAIFGFFLFAIISYMVVDASVQRRSVVTRLARLFWRHFDDTPLVVHRLRLLVRPHDAFKTGLYALSLLVLALLMLAVTGQWIIVLLLPLLVVSVALAFTGDRKPEHVFVWLMAFTGFLISLGVEIFFLRDWLQGGSAYRMNTIFKFYIEVWIFLALASAVGLAVVTERIHLTLRRPGRLTFLWYICLAILLFCVALFPILATPARVNDRFPGARPPVGTLDGAAFMTVGKYTFDWQGKNYTVDLRYEYDAIQWLLRNVQGSPVIAEASLPYYRELGSRVSAFTGLPTLIGPQHEQEQRPGDTQVGPRENELRTIYNDASFQTITPLLKKNNVRYIYVGQLEQVYSPSGLAKFDQAVGQYVDLVYENGKVKIYKVRDNL